MLEKDREWRQTVDSVLAAFDVAASDVEPIRTTNNAVFRLRRNGAADLALRLHRPGHRTSAHIRSELMFMAAVARDGTVTVPEPVPTRNGDLVTSPEAGVPLASIITWLDGEPLRPGHGLGPRRVRRVGVTHAHLHRIAAHFEAPSGFDLPMLTVDRLLRHDPMRGLWDGAGELASRVNERLSLVEQLVTQRLTSAERAGSSFGVIHNDFILQHCLHQRLTVGVIDFDDAGWGFYLQDLGGILGNLQDYSSYLALRHNLFEGYRSVRPLPSEIEADLALMIAFRHATVVVWAVDVQASGLMAADRAGRVIDDRLDEIDRNLAGHDLGG